MYHVRPLDPPLIPVPAELELHSDSDAFALDASTSIQLDPDASDQTLFAARQLQKAIQRATGLRLLLTRTRQRNSIALAARSRDDFGPQGYGLRVAADEIEVTASSEAGVFYAVQTLKQLVATRGARLPALTIADRPVIAQRGVMLDVSRGKVPTLATLFDLVDRLAAYKYNQLQLYVEHTFHFPKHPGIGEGSDPLTADDILALDAFCRARHVELVPNLQSFGHQRHLLAMPEYSHLDEVGWRWSLTPAREDTYRLLDDLYSDFLPEFSSRWLNVDCDETWDLGTGQSRAVASQIGRGRLYLQHILRLRELAARYGRRIMLWADVLHHYPELVAELPEDVLLLDWQYEAAAAYPTTEALARSGRAFWVCPGTSTWNTLFPRLDNAIGNIRTYVSEGLRAGATGMLLTDWGDYGHYQSLALSWHPYLFGAATAWTGARTTPEQFDSAFAPLFFGRPADDASVMALRRLGRAVAGPGLGLRNRSAIALALFEDPLTGRASLEAGASSFEELAAAADAAVAAWASLPDADLRHEYGFAARLVGFAARKALQAQRIRRLLGSGASASGLHAEIALLARAREQARALRAEFETNWLRQARRSEMQLTLDHFDALDRNYAGALGWLASGQTDTDLTTYSPQPVALLWEQGVADLRGLVTLAGSDALPEEVRAGLHPAPAE